MLSDSDLIEAFVSAPTGPDSVSESVVNDLVDDILLEFALGVHRDCKTGKLTMTDCFNLDMSAQQVEFSVVTAAPSPAPSASNERGSLGSQSSSTSSVLVKCPACGDVVNGLRFAPHLEKCLTGGGRRQTATVRYTDSAYSTTSSSSASSGSSSDLASKHGHASSSSSSSSSSGTSSSQQAGSSSSGSKTKPLSASSSTSAASAGSKTSKSKKRAAGGATTIEAAESKSSVLSATSGIGGKHCETISSSSTASGSDKKSNGKSKSHGGSAISASAVSAGSGGTAVNRNNSTIITGCTPSSFAAAAPVTDATAVQLMISLGSAASGGIDHGAVGSGDVAGDGDFTSTVGQNAGGEPRELSKYMRRKLLLLQLKTLEAARGLGSSLGGIDINQNHSDNVIEMIAKRHTPRLNKDNAVQSLLPSSSSSHAEVVGDKASISPIPTAITSATPSCDSIASSGGGEHGACNAFPAAPTETTLLADAAKETKTENGVDQKQMQQEDCPQDAAYLDIVMVKEQLLLTIRSKAAVAGVVKPSSSSSAPAKVPKVPQYLGVDRKLPSKMSWGLIEKMVGDLSVSAAAASASAGAASAATTDASLKVVPDGASSLSPAVDGSSGLAATISTNTLTATTVATTAAVSAVTTVTTDSMSSNESVEGIAVCCDSGSITSGNNSNNGNNSGQQQQQTSLVAPSQLSLPADNAPIIVSIRIKNHKPIARQERLLVPQEYFDSTLAQYKAYQQLVLLRQAQQEEHMKRAVQAKAGVGAKAATQTPVVSLTAQTQLKAQQQTSQQLAQQQFLIQQQQQQLYQQQLAMLRSRQQTVGITGDSSGIGCTVNSNSHIGASSTINPNSHQINYNLLHREKIGVQGWSQQQQGLAPSGYVQVYRPQQQGQIGTNVSVPVSGIQMQSNTSSSSHHINMNMNNSSFNNNNNGVVQTQDAKKMKTAHPQQTAGVNMSLGVNAGVGINSSGAHLITNAQLQAMPLDQRNMWLQRQKQQQQQLQLQLEHMRQQYSGGSGPSALTSSGSASSSAAVNLNNSMHVNSMGNNMTSVPAPAAAAGGGGTASAPGVGGTGGTLLSRGMISGPVSQQPQYRLSPQGQGQEQSPTVGAMATAIPITHSPINRMSPAGQYQQQQRSPIDAYSPGQLPSVGLLLSQQSQIQPMQLPGGTQLTQQQQQQLLLAQQGQKVMLPQSNKYTGQMQTQMHGQGHSGGQPQPQQGSAPKQAAVLTPSELQHQQQLYQQRQLLTQARAQQQTAAGMVIGVAGSTAHGQGQQQGPVLEQQTLTHMQTHARAIQLTPQQQQQFQLQQQQQFALLQQQKGAIAKIDPVAGMKASTSNDGVTGTDLQQQFQYQQLVGKPQQQRHQNNLSTGASTGGSLHTTLAAQQQQALMQYAQFQQREKELQASKAQLVATITSGDESLAAIVQNSWNSSGISISNSGGGGVNGPVIGNRDEK